MGVELSTKQNSQSIDSHQHFNMAAEYELSRACAFVNAEKSYSNACKYVCNADLIAIILIFAKIFPSF